MGSTFRKGSAQTGQATGGAQDVLGTGMDLYNKYAIPGLDLTAKLEGTYGGQLGDFATAGKLPVPFEQILGQGAQQIGTQGTAANQSILDTGVRGGGLQDALVRAQAVRMGGLDALRANVGGTLYGQGLNMAGNPYGLQVAGTGLNAALGGTAQLNQLGQERMGQNQAFQGGLGSAIGTGVGAYFGGPAGAKAGGRIGGK